MWSRECDGKFQIKYTTGVSIKISALITIVSFGYRLNMKQSYYKSKVRITFILQIAGDDQPTSFTIQSSL